MTPYTPGEQPKERKFIKLNTNENPYPPSPKVVEAVKAAVDDRLKLYPGSGFQQAGGSAGPKLWGQGEPGLCGQRL